MKNFETTGSVSEDGKLTVNLDTGLKQGIHRLKIEIDEEPLPEPKHGNVLGLFEGNASLLGEITEEIMMERENSALRK